METAARDKPLFYLVAGARPNFMKIAPLLRELDRHNSRVKYRLIHTGQHYDRSMSDVFFEELGIPQPDYHLEVGSGTHAHQTASVMIAFEDVCDKEMPDLVIVVGDVNSTLACSIVAKKLNIPVAHVEAGLRSGDMSMPEEVNRVVTDSISDYFFVTENAGVDNLLREGKSRDRIHFVGHVMIDNLFHQIAKLKEMDTDAFSTAALKRNADSYGVLTLHRPSNVDSPEALKKIVTVIDAISQRLPIFFVVHPRTRQAMERFAIDVSSSVIQTESLPFMEFLNLWTDAKVVLTDSGGLQEETTACGVPCITLRENTERPVTVSEGTNTLVGNDPKKIEQAFNNVLTRTVRENYSRPAMWDGHASARIVSILLEDFARPVEPAAR